MRKNKIIFIIFIFFILFLIFIFIFKKIDIKNYSNNLEISKLNNEKLKIDKPTKKSNDILEDELVWSILKTINEDDFKYIKDKTKLTENIYESLISIKSINDDNLFYCDKLSLLKETPDEAIKYCKWNFYIFKALFKKDNSICKNLEKWFEDIYIMWSNKSAFELCNSLYSLTKFENINETNISNFVKNIYDWKINTNTVELFNTYFLNNNNCNNIDIVSTKLRCLSLFYKDSFFINFNTEIYKELIKSKYLYE